MQYNECPPTNWMHTKNNECTQNKISALKRLLAKGNWRGVYNPLGRGGAYVPQINALGSFECIRLPPTSSALIKHGWYPPLQCFLKQVGSKTTHQPPAAPLSGLLWKKKKEAFPQICACQRQTTAKLLNSWQPNVQHQSTRFVRL